jgi:hypothetical protein
VLKEEFEWRSGSSTNGALISPTSSDTHPNTNDSIFDFAPPSAKRRSVSELDRFFEEPSDDLNCLHSMPTMKQIFLRYNTPAPSSATLERAFCTAGAILSKRRGQLSDKNVESLMVIKFSQINLE